jgi:hypothetical protein
MIEWIKPAVVWARAGTGHAVRPRPTATVAVAADFKKARRDTDIESSSVGKYPLKSFPASFFIPGICLAPFGCQFGPKIAAQKG